MSDTPLTDATPRVNSWLNSYRSGAITWIEFKEALQGLERELAALRARLAELEELHRMQLAGIMTATVQNTERTIKDRIDRSNPYWTVAYGDVCVAIDREMALRARVLQAEALLERIAKQSVSKPDYWSSCGQCESNTEDAKELLAAWRAPASGKREEKL